jgi:hypothetical protein
MAAGKPVLHYWYAALSSERGIELVCSDAEAVRQRLYSARREAKDFDLDAISVCVSPFDPMRLWLVRKTPDEKT